MAPAMVVPNMEDGDFHDYEAIHYVIEALDKVIMDDSGTDQIDRDQFDELLGIVDPSKKMNSDDEALLTTTLRALSHAVLRIDPVFHGALLCNVFSLSIWTYGVDTRNAVVELITNLAVVPDKFLDDCLHMLVSNFSSPRKMRESFSQARWYARKKEVHGLLQRALNYITDMVPVAPMRLKEIIDKRMPRYTEPKEVIMVFVECMLALESNEIGEFLGSTLLAKVIDLLTELDVNISWEDILQEDVNKGIFEVELGELEENLHDDMNLDAKHNEEATYINGNALADKLDGMMIIVCEHLKTSASNGHLLKVFEILAESFRRTVLNTYKSKFIQFVIFYACSLDPDICGLKFAVLLTDLFLSKSEDPVSRMSAIAYLASYLSRAKFVSPYVVAQILERLVDWCSNYCHSQNGRDRSLNPVGHRVFYSACQAIMYILCFRMRTMMDIPELKAHLVDLQLEQILSHQLNPLKVCLPSIVQEFLRQASDARLFNKSMALLTGNLLECELSKAYGGVERLDMFFPFDPYLLKQSDRYMRPNFEFWSMVKKTYSNCNSEDEDELDGLDAPNFEDEHDDGFDDDSEEEDLEYSMNKMSITPRPLFEYRSSNNQQIQPQMPARIRPSVSPPN